MKTKLGLSLRTIIVLATCLMSGGCGRVMQNDNAEFTQVCLEETVHLTTDTSSPYCDFSMDYSFLTENDSMDRAINRHIQREILGDEYALLAPEAAVDSFKNDYLRDYREAAGELYRFHLEQNTQESAVPSWYGQTYSLLTFFDEGRSGLMTFTADIFVDTGGAHPNQWSRWMNFRLLDGSLIALDDAFPPHSHEGLKTLLLGALIRQQAEAHPEEEIKTVDDLRQRGILQFTEMYIPQNFLLGKEAASFLYNRYDIAPYVEGSIVLELPYREVEPYINNELWN